MVLRPPGLAAYVADEGLRFLRKRKVLANREVPDDIYFGIEHLAECVVDPDHLALDGPEGEAYRLTFVRAFRASPTIFLPLMSRMQAFYARQGPILKALRDHQTIRYHQAGRLVTKNINEATSKDIATFIAEEYGEDVEPKAVAKQRERLAGPDRARADAAWRVLLGS